MKTGIESLHNHTIISDGQMNHKEIFFQAQKRGFSVFAFTDHDALPHDEALEFLESVRGEPMKWVIGIEMTTAYPEQAGGAKNGSMHLIGLFVDPKNIALLDYCRRAQEARVNRMVTMVNSLRILGFTITPEDCLRIAGKDSVGRPHIVTALHQYPENLALEAKLKNDMYVAAQTNPQLAIAYKNMIEQGEKSYPYYLYLSHDAFRPVYVEVTYLPSFDESVALIRRAGGVALIAHYYTTSKHISLPLVKELLDKGKLDGVEVVYGSHQSGQRNDTIHIEREQLKMLIKQCGAIAGGGGDIHDMRDMDAYLGSRDVVEDSVGLSLAILQSGKVNPAHSSIAHRV